MPGGLVSGFARRQGPRRVLAPPASGLTGQGVGSETAAPKISELPNVAGQSACGAGLGAGVPGRRESRPGPKARQSAPVRGAVQTPTPPARGAAVYTESAGGPAGRL